MNAAVFEGKERMENREKRRKEKYDFIRRDIFVDDNEALPPKDHHKEGPKEASSVRMTEVSPSGEGEEKKENLLVLRLKGKL